MIFNSKTSNRKFSCPCIYCQVHVFETEYPNTLLNTMIKYNMNKHSGPLLQKSNFSPPGMINFSNFFITPKTFQLSLGVAGKRNTDFVSFVTILPIFAAKRPDYMTDHAFLNWLIIHEIARKRNVIKTRQKFPATFTAKNAQFATSLLISCNRLVTKS